MSRMNVSAWRSSDVSSQSLRGVSQQERKTTVLSDDGLEFPPAAYPFREFLTASLFLVLIGSLIAWGGWKILTLLWQIV